MKPQRRLSDYCEFQLENAFLGLYKQQGIRNGIDHFAIGVDDYKPAVALEKLKREFPSAAPWLENEEQVSFRDPDGAKGQLTATNYMR
jgi:hypothetical protein